LAGASDEIAEYGNVGAVGAKATRVDRKAETLGKFEIDIGVIEFREAEAGGGQHAIEAARIDGSRRAMTLPRAARQFVELLPIAFVPSRHAVVLKYVRFKALDAKPR
jgi:hypothetical protein